MPVLARKLPLFTGEAMGKTRCPKCNESTPDRLPISELAAADYWRCGVCGFVWTSDKRLGPVPTESRGKPDESESDSR
jgi:hypothetical protein